MTGYCKVAPGHPWHQPYHDHEYGFAVPDDDALFERLILEINQAGLSWLTILKKREGFRAAYAGFRIAEVAAFDDADRARLLADAGIVRNRLKVDAAIANARAVRELQDRHGSFRAWLDGHGSAELPAWLKVFRKTFRFTGGEIVNEFLMSTGYLPGAHAEDCPVHRLAVASHPPWRRQLESR